MNRLNISRYVYILMTDGTRFQWRWKSTPPPGVRKRVELSPIFDTTEQAIAWVSEPERAAVFDQPKVSRWNPVEESITE